MKKRYLKKANELIRSFIVANYTKITVQPGVCRYNHHCHANAVHDAVQDNQNRIAMVVYFDGDCPIVHFINHHIRPEKFVDNTLGYWATTSDYYFIRWIAKEEFNNVFVIHNDYRKVIKGKLPWFTRWISKFEA